MRVVVLCGHAIFNKETKRWEGGFPGQEVAYEKQVQEAVKMVGSGILILSGGRTRPRLSCKKISEAEGIRDFIGERWSLSNIPNMILEKWARDSFENIFFSILACQSDLREIPSEVILISFGFKSLRFQIIATTLGVPNFRFFGSGDKLLSSDKRIDALKSEAKLLENILEDPYHQRDFLKKKRAQRMPQNISKEEYLATVKARYSKSEDVDLIDRIYKEGRGYKEAYLKNRI